jgi:hypothetical protein
MHKQWIYRGAAIILFSIVMGILGIVWALQGMRTNESAGVGVVGIGPIIAILLALVGAASGSLVMLIGLYKRSRR